MKQWVRLAIVLVVAALSGASGAFAQSSEDQPCGVFRDSNCVPIVENPDDMGTSGARICRATWGDPKTYCYIQAWDDEGRPVKCTRGLTNSGWCHCDPDSGNLRGSCSMQN